MGRVGSLVMGLLLATAVVACAGGGKGPSTPTPHRIIVRSAVDGVWYVIEKEDLQKAVQEEVAKAGQQVTVEMGTYLFMPAKEPNILYWCNSKEKQEVLDDCIKIENVLIKLGY
jgi:hypothetical protein